jgi:hypothetical protein
MSATEVIEQIKALPAEERMEVIRWAREFFHLENTVDGESFRRPADAVFEKHGELLDKLGTGHEALSATENGQAEVRNAGADVIRDYPELLRKLADS